MRLLLLSNESSLISFLQKLKDADIGEILHSSKEEFLAYDSEFQNISLLIVESSTTTLEQLSSFSFARNYSIPVVYVLSDSDVCTPIYFDEISSNNALQNVEVIYSSSSINEICYRISKTIRQFQLVRFKNEVVTLKDQVLSIIAHDLKNVFVGLQGLSKNLALMTEGLDEETIDYFSLLELGIDQGYLLLINLLEWAKLQSGQSLLKFETLSLFEVIEQNVSLLHPMSYKKSQVVQSTIDKNISVYCDKNMVSSVIRNIMNNAMKFTPEYGKISINAEKNEENNSVTISISDTGIGIAEDQIKKIFFTDSTDTTTGTSGELGTGLGLLLCKDLIQRNSGTFWVKSTLGQGTTFFFTIPINPIA